jgi:spermidine synthase
MHGIKRVIFSKKSRVQYIDIIETYDYGLMLILDGKVQSTIRDEHFYHEALVHPIMSAHPRPEKVLIIGGGEGATLREVLRHPTVKQVIMVDIDIDVIKCSKEYLPQLSSGAFEDKRTNLIISDGRKFVESCKEKFDVIIIDVTDPLEEGPGQFLYTVEFYEAVKRVLNDNGIMVTQATSIYYSTYCFTTIYRTIKKVFEKAGCYSTWTPAYDSMWGFVYGSKGPDPKSLSKDDIDAILNQRGLINTKYYNGKIHEKLFILPKEIEEQLEKGGIATDKSPTFMPA